MKAHAGNLIIKKSIMSFIPPQNHRTKFLPNLGGPVTISFKSTTVFIGTLWGQRPLSNARNCDFFK